MRLRFWRKPYDPMPELRAARDQLFFGLAEEQKTGKISKERFRRCLAALNESFESFALYATVGKDRKRLDQGFVTRFHNEVLGLWEPGSPKCAHCGEPIKLGQLAIATPWLHAAAKMHRGCCERSEAGEAPTRNSSGAYGLFQLLPPSRR